MKQVEKWGMFEASMKGKAEGNPFTDYENWGEFTQNGKMVRVRCFYDGGSTYRVRYMPEEEGMCAYRIYGDSFDEELTGEFEVTAPGKGNHGPVQVQDKIYLNYADGEHYHSIGTTCYAWVHQPLYRQEETLATLKNSCFNKIRFCFFPKFYLYNEAEPMTYPYERCGEARGQDPSRKREIFRDTDKEVADITDFDCYRLNPEHFQRFDERIAQLRDMGIEADMILLHPYDKWGFASMTNECYDIYLKYVVARYGAYRNIWWSMANEYNLFFWDKKEWSRMGRLVAAEDPYHHMISIHNCMDYFDYTEEWITHCSMQRIDLYKIVETTDESQKIYGKPVVWDEIQYEGDIGMGWGDITPQEMVRRFWETMLRGGYPGHGETYLDHYDEKLDNNVLWWSHGGKLYGESEPRFAFMKQFWDEVPGGRFMNSGTIDELCGIPLGEKSGRNWETHITDFASYELHYYGFMRPGYMVFEIPKDRKFQITVIDTYEMTTTDVGIHSGKTRVLLPRKQWMAIRLIEVK